jgi:hypothetical protein
MQVLTEREPFRGTFEQLGMHRSSDLRCQWTCSEKSFVYGFSNEINEHISVNRDFAIT